MHPQVIKRSTIARSVSLEGIGVHTGVAAKVTLEPADNGIAFCRTDKRPQSFTLSPRAITPSPLCTLLTSVGTGLTLAAARGM